MAMMNPKGRVNYEPNSWGGAAGGPRECPKTGFRSFPAEESGRKVRERSETFADHYSQALQFYLSQTETEQKHIADALIFELSKVETSAIRKRMVSHLSNIDEQLASRVRTGLGIRDEVQPATPAVAPRKDLKPSSALSILRNGPSTFSGRKVGALLTEGADAAVFSALRDELKKEGALLEIIAPTVGGVELSNGTQVEAQQKIGGGPSILYDAVVILASDKGIQAVAKNASVTQFVMDAFAHLKFIGWSPAARAVFEKAGIAGMMDDGFIQLTSAATVPQFVTECRKLRNWSRAEIVSV